MEKQDLLSTGKLAKELGVSAKVVKQAIEKAGVEPRMSLRAHEYYGSETTEKIKAAIEK